MLSKKFWLPALVMFSLALPGVARAQQMGGGDEKKDEPKPEEPAKPAEGGEKKADEPKAGEAKKTLSFTAPASFKDDKGGRGTMKHLFKLDAVEGEQEAGVFVIYVGPNADYEKEKDRWVKAFEDKDGKKLEKSAVKEEAFDANGVKGKQAEVTGNFAARRGGGKKKGEEGADKPAEKKWTKVINIFLEGPDGGWILRLQGGEKTVDKYKADFIAYAKTAKVVDKTGDDKPARKKKGE